MNPVTLREGRIKDVDRRNRWGMLSYEVESEDTMPGTCKVYETVVYDPSRGTGAAGDCTHVIRSTSRAVVKRAARGMTYYGAPATVRCEDVPLRVFRRWQDEGKI